MGIPQDQSPFNLLSNTSNLHTKESGCRADSVCPFP
ncbi:hypothetical protein VIBHAR_05432 [Vibrio campbellii ATCC BAA-1116]|uniref:Uncharacterized protein n=1 Tax=Vibrio campbellii (strain ATCC BAA-1116) TaxID=2902295 RepID=A7N7H4_VIBC1|nr:hypothetical protein VIBHAR_05432 [Vibrio campbellii ATCC BAA-1116]